MSRKRGRVEAAISAELERLNAAYGEALAGQGRILDLCFRRAERRAGAELRALEAEMMGECVSQAYSIDRPDLVRDYGNGHVTELGENGEVLYERF